VVLGAGRVAPASGQAARGSHEASRASAAAWAREMETRARSVVRSKRSKRHGDDPATGGLETVPGDDDSVRAAPSEHGEGLGQDQ
jgi:hypothetical protein